jgi:type II secretory pathway pseudopilin PulG
MKHKALPLPVSHRRLRAGFTLTEIMIASTIALVVIAAVMAIVLAVTKSTRKTEFLAEALQNSREVQEFLKREVSSAIKKDSIANGLGLSFGEPNGSGRYARLSYRVPVGNPLMIAADAAKGSSTLVLATPAGVSVAVGDYVVISVPNTGDRLRVVSVTDPGPGSDRDVTVTLSKKIEDATNGEKIDIEASKTIYVSVYRDRKFEVADPGAAAVTSLRWWENASDNTTVRTLSTQVAATARYMFEPIPNDLGTAKPELEHAVRWHFTYQGNSPVTGLIPGSEPFWNRNETEGVLWPGPEIRKTTPATPASTIRPPRSRPRPPRPTTTSIRPRRPPRPQPPRSRPRRPPRPRPPRSRPRRPPSHPPPRSRPRRHQDDDDLVKTTSTPNRQQAADHSPTADRREALTFLRMRTQDKHGSLPVTLLFSFVLLAIVVGLLSLSVSSFRLTARNEFRAQARTIAESELEHLYYLFKDAYSSGVKAANMVASMAGKGVVDASATPTTTRQPYLTIHRDAGWTVRRSMKRIAYFEGVDAESGDEGTTNYFEVRVEVIAPADSPWKGQSIRYARQFSSCSSVVFQKCIFYQGDLEFAPGGDIEIYGDIVANGSVYLGASPSGSLTLRGNVTYQKGYGFNTNPGSDGLFGTADDSGVYSTYRKPDTPTGSTLTAPTFYYSQAQQLKEADSASNYLGGLDAVALQGAYPDLFPTVNDVYRSLIVPPPSAGNTNEYTAPTTLTDSLAAGAQRATTQRASSSRSSRPAT